MVTTATAPPRRSARAIKWRLIESVHTIEEAKAWMFNRQDGRRNWSPNRRAMYIAEAYEAAKVESGRRTDVYRRRQDRHRTGDRRSSSA